MDCIRCGIFMETIERGGWGSSIESRVGFMGRRLAANEGRSGFYDEVRLRADAGAVKFISSEAGARSILERDRLLQFPRIPIRGRRQVELDRIHRNGAHPLVQPLPMVA